MELKFEITEELGILSENEKGWRKELNLVMKENQNMI